MERLGPEDYQSNRHIRKLLRLSGASKRDVFFDLGCGRGQLCITAVVEFGVRKAVGIELHKGRAAKATKRVEELGLSDRIEIRNEDFMESDLHEATIAYCGLTEMEEDVQHFGTELQPGCRFVSLFLPFVGVIPSAADYPFYVMEVPFKRTEDVSLWISKTLFKRATIGELFQELDTDREYRYDKRIFSRMMRERFPVLETGKPSNPDDLTRD
jgi:SAM-dependent methyltransferase